jgi:hypothetical protein
MTLRLYHLLLKRGIYAVAPSPPMAAVDILNEAEAGAIVHVCSEVLYACPLNA